MSVRPGITSLATAGCTIAIELGRGLVVRERGLGQSGPSMVPSMATTSSPNASTTRSNTGVPGCISPWATVVQIDHDSAP